MGSVCIESKKYLHGDIPIDTDDDMMSSPLVFCVFRTRLITLVVDLEAFNRKRALGCLTSMQIILIQISGGHDFFLRTTRWPKFASGWEQHAEATFGVATLPLEGNLHDATDDNCSPPIETFMKWVKLLL